MAERETREGCEVSDFLSPTDVTRYGRDGYLYPVDVLTAEEVTRYRACLQSALDSEDGTVQKILRYKGHVALGWLAELIRHPGILGPVKDLLGPDLLCLTVNFFKKRRTTRRSSLGTKMPPTGTW
jgi:hypothetical protein